VDDPESVASKKAALEAYSSQFTIGEDTYARASGAPILFDTPERFTRLRPPARGFASYGILSRIIACVFALGLGVVVGAILTVVHQSTIVIGSTTVPAGLIAALAVSAAL